MLPEDERRKSLRPDEHQKLTWYVFGRIKDVCMAHNVTPKQLWGASKAPNVVRARESVIAEVRERAWMNHPHQPTAIFYGETPPDKPKHYPLSWPWIGEYLNKDHSTIIAAFRRVTQAERAAAQARLDAEAAQLCIPVSTCQNILDEKWADEA